MESCEAGAEFVNFAPPPGRSIFNLLRGANIGRKCAAAVEGDNMTNEAMIFLGSMIGGMIAYCLGFGMGWWMRGR